jgi:hypothetical protein
MPMKKSDAVLQFEVVLQDIAPSVWRRFQIPEKGATFWSLHCAIQDSFGWLDYHLHEFRNKVGDADVRIGIPDGDVPPQIEGVLASWRTPLQAPFLVSQLLYVYDFGDDWKHQVTFEGPRDRAPGRKYPCCLDGERACPPEDCGGPFGYADFLEAVANPDHPQHSELLRWAGGSFDPEDFEASAVRFSNPKVRLRKAGLGVA